MFLSATLQLKFARIARIMDEILPQNGDLLIIKREVDKPGWTILNGISLMIYTGGDIETDALVYRQTDESISDEQHEEE